MRNSLMLIRGLPSSGKTTFASVFLGESIAADDYPGLYQNGVFMGGQEVEGIPMIKLAHIWCQNRVASFMFHDKHTIIVTNTFTQRWEMEPYFALAEEHGYRTYVVDLYDGGKSDEELADRSAHGVPVEVIKAMRDRYEHDWKNGSPVRPDREGQVFRTCS